MRFLVDIPIKRKLTWVILVTSTAGLLSATLALFVFQLVTFRQRFVDDLGVLSQLVANQSSVALDFEDKATAQRILAALQSNPNIVSALVKDQDGSEFARIGSNQYAWRDLPKDGSRLDGDYLLYVRPILSNSSQIGTLYLRAEYKKAFDQLVRAHVGTLAAVLAGSILLTLALCARLQRVISDPILRLAETARTVADKKDYSARASKLGKDELGLFTEAFNQMLAQIQSQDTALQTAHDQLEERVNALQHEIGERERAERQLEIAHRELLEASRRAGMAEVATGVLHNVGNVLNSVNVTANLLRDSVRKSEVTTVQKVAGLLRDHEHDLGAFLTSDRRGRQVPVLLHALGEQLTVERGHMQIELELLARNIEHIKNIVAMQQSYASVAGFVERVEIEGLVEDALEINAAALARHGIEIARSFDEVPPLLVDKHKVLQVLVNLIQNAKYALDEGGRLGKQLTLSIKLIPDRAVQIGVRDNGIGIQPEHLTCIFAHGFTTRRKGHGFGLHASALAAQEMGGELKGYSDGLNKGATFILELPLFIKEGTS